MKKVAEHKDLKDEGQTVKVKNGPVVSPPPKTGDDNRLRFFVVLFGGALSALSAYAVREGIRSLRRRKESLKNIKKSNEDKAPGLTGAFAMQQNHFRKG